MNFTTTTKQDELEEKIEAVMRKDIHEGVQYGEASLLITLLKYALENTTF